MKDKNSILASLNEPQRKAVLHTEGPLMVIAGAGSGKTRVLTYRIAHMLSEGKNPYQILALTFTNKAATEMRERIFELVGEASAKAVMMGTFHSVFYKILRVEGEKLGYTRNLTVYDTDDSKNLIKSIIKEMNLDPKVYAAGHVLNRISGAKSNLLSHQDYLNNPEIQAADIESGKPHIGEIFVRYNTRLRNSDAMDFDDLLYYMNVLLRDFPEMLHKYQNRYQYILVDEYQDTNFAQYLIIKKLSSSHHNICIVGDDAQSIYSFRGANIQNILNFKRDYPEATIIKLEQNYRSSQNIVNAANAVIKCNKDQLYKEVWTENDEGNKINIFQTNSDSEEAQLVANTIFEYKQNFHVNNNQFAILYRTNAQSRSLEEALIKRNIPYIIYGGLSFYKRKEIKDVLAYYRLSINHFDEESLRRIINYPQRGIGLTTMEKVIVCANQHKTRIWNILENPDHFGLDVNRPTKERLIEFITKIKSFSSMIPTTDAYELGKHIVVSVGILKDLSEDKSDLDRKQNMEELLDSMKEFTEKEPELTFNEQTGELINDYFPSIDQFMESVALLTDEEEKDETLNDKVKLMTIHSAKGLEFDYVFLTGLEENLFPSSMSLGSRAELEEERRLFYVAITRAKNTLTISHALTRYRFGTLQYCEQSRFLNEIPIKYINFTEKASMGRGLFASHGAPSILREKSNTQTIQFRKKENQQIATERKLQVIGKEATIEQILPNVRVFHEKFGFGVVKQTDGNGLETKAVVDFETVGTKTLLLKFAKLILPD